MDKFQFKLTNVQELSQAINELKQTKFDIILLDLGLPDSSGFQTLINTRRVAQNIPIIVLTGLKDEDLARKAVQVGAQDYLVKGQVDSEPLIRSIFHAIDRNDMIRTIRSLADDLSKKEKKLRDIIQISPIAIIITDTNGIIQFCNPETKKLFKGMEKTLMGRRFKTLVDNERTSHHVSIRMNEDEIKYAEIETVDFTWEMKDAKLITLRDITRDIEYKKLLEESEHKYRHLFNKFPFPMVVLNKNGLILDCTSNFTTLTGIKKQKIVNHSYKETFLKPIEQLQLFSEIYDLDSIQELPDFFELCLNTSNRHKMWLELKFYTSTLNNELLLHVICRDITKIRASEEEMIRLEKNLHEMNSLIEYAPLAIIFISPNAQILRTNWAAQELLQYNEEDLLNSNILDFISKSHAQKIEGYYKGDIYNLKKQNKIETTLIRKDKRLIEVEITSTILKIGKNIIIQSFISDITSRKQNERNRELLLDQLHKSLEFKDRFLAETSHDLRTPLNAIIGFSSILLEKSYGDLNATQFDFLNDILSAAEHLDDLITSMLDFSKMQIGKLNLKKNYFSLCELLINLQSIFKPKYENKGLLFIIENIDEDLSIYADRLRFKQILYNLIDNAIKFTQKGKILFRCLTRSDHWEFQLKDTGIGIKKEDYDLVFREFGRIENDVTTDISGSGIGLALTKRLIQLHEGAIWFESEEDKGTTFFFTIPMDQDA